MSSLPMVGPAVGLGSAMLWSSSSVTHLVRVEGVLVWWSGICCAVAVAMILQQNGPTASTLIGVVPAV